MLYKKSGEAICALYVRPFHSATYALPRLVLIYFKISCHQRQLNSLPGRVRDGDIYCHRELKTYESASASSSGFPVI